MTAIWDIWYNEPHKSTRYRKHMRAGSQPHTGNVYRLYTRVYRRLVMRIVIYWIVRFLSICRNHLHFRQHLNLPKRCVHPNESWKTLVLQIFFFWRWYVLKRIQATLLTCMIRHEFNQIMNTMKWNTTTRFLPVLQCKMQPASRGAAHDVRCLATQPCHQLTPFYQSRLTQTQLIISLQAVSKCRTLKATLLQLHI